MLCLDAALSGKETFSRAIRAKGESIVISPPGTVTPEATRLLGSILRHESGMPIFFTGPGACTPRPMLSRDFSTLLSTKTLSATPGPPRSPRFCNNWLDNAIYATLKSHMRRARSMKMKMN